MKENRPNFLVFVADQLRYDHLGCAGHPFVQTPNIDALATKGIRFDRCYTNQPMCMATRATWFTGRTPRSHGVRCNGIPLRKDIPTMPEALNKAGYRTHSIGKIHINPWMPHSDYNTLQLNPLEWPEAIPLWREKILESLPSPYYGIETADLLVGNYDGNYRQWLLEKDPNCLEKIKMPSSIGRNGYTPEISWKSSLPTELHMTSWASERAEYFLESQKNSENPFFLWCSIPDPHPPYSCDDPWFSMYSDFDLPNPKRRENELDSLPPHYKQLYDSGIKTAGRIAKTSIPLDVEHKAIRTMLGMISQWDNMVGRVVSKLKEYDLYEDTVIIVMSDHGQMAGDHWMYNMPPTHLDGVLRVPCIWHCPKIIDQSKLSESLISHLDFAPTVLDLAEVPIPEGNTPPQPEAPMQRSAWPGKSFAPILKGEEEKTQDSIIAENDADYLGLRQRTVITEDWHITCYTGEEYGELFDLKNDPEQLYNLWNAPEHRETKRDLQILLMERFAEADSTLPRRLAHA